MTEHNTIDRETFRMLVSMMIDEMALLADRAIKAERENRVLKAQTGQLHYDIKTSTISHEQLNRLIALFDGAGAKGQGDMEAQARWVVEELKAARHSLETSKCG